MYQGRETVLKYDIWLGLANVNLNLHGSMALTSLAPVWHWRSKGEVMRSSRWMGRYSGPFTWFAKPSKISYLSTFSRPWYISWCKYILKIDF